jgi:hypothetical protein
MQKTAESAITGWNKQKKTESAMLSALLFCCMNCYLRFTAFLQHHKSEAGF